MCDIIQTEQVMFRIHIYICIYSFACNNNEKRGNKFEREKGGLCGKVWREEREGGKDVIVM